ncbi:hypothetical protein STRCI_001266 [Streptomyces cinnabarinus]|uniref:DUF2190 domain-containing protein n=1 Tax=Streptomyces cinnabarinus TaxID=67287 RepID=A0ABY7KAL4_9ACTN|nr:hypothetical protein [Streptomyces cinnabarinus]WAZ20167.1 hypothetical protein STRCI_001266 [Streptomyces cinnabarinus]
MAALTTNVVPLAGIRFDDKLVAAAGGGDTAQTGAGVLLAIKNADASPHTVTIATPGTVEGLAIADRPVTVPAGQTYVVPITDRYRDPSTGRAALTYDGVTSVTVGVFRVA